MSKTSSSYGNIVKATTIMGGGSAAHVVLGIVRTKVFAVLLGPSGVGLIGIYLSVTNMALILAGMGINRSGVRQIAEAAGSNDEVRIATTIHALRRVSLFLGFLGSALMVFLSVPISHITFGDGEHWVAISIVGLSVMFTAISNGQMALVQGLRRLGDLVRIKVLGSVWGTLLGIPIIWLWRDKGVVWMLVILSVMSVLTSWYYARQVEVRKVAHAWAASFAETKSLLRLGLAFMGSGLVGAATVYLLRLIIIHRLGLDAVGQYTAVYTLCGVYTGFILSAMGSDFYPRLTAVASDNAQCNRLVNEQAEVALLMAGPGLAGVLTLAPWVMYLFYSAEFAPSVDVLRWQVLGLFGQVASWPMGFILLAQGRGRTFFVSELISNAMHLLLTWIMVRQFGLTGSGMAFCFVYVFYWVFIFAIVRRLTGFSWSGANLKLFSTLIPALLAVFLSSWWLPPAWALGFGLVVTAGVSIYCLRGLVQRIGLLSISSQYEKIRCRFGFLPKFPFA